METGIKLMLMEDLSGEWVDSGEEWRIHTVIFSILYGVEVFPPKRWQTLLLRRCAVRAWSSPKLDPRFGSMLCAGRLSYPCNGGLHHVPGLGCFWLWFTTRLIHQHHAHTHTLPLPLSSVSRQTYAKLHGTFWKDPTLLSHSWLRGARWLCGDAREQWESTQQIARRQWDAGKARGSCTEFDPLVVAAVERGLAGISWEQHAARLNEHSNWTLVHGDCWPGRVVCPNPHRVWWCSSVLSCGGSYVALCFVMC
jgi:hypothetical protein